MAATVERVIDDDVVDDDAAEDDVMVEVITSCGNRHAAGVLPWTECPSAAASAGRLAGRPGRCVAGRWCVMTSLGTSTCTHLNDLLASLAQADHLV